MYLLPGRFVCPLSFAAGSPLLHLKMRQPTIHSMNPAEANYTSTCHSPPPPPPVAEPNHATTMDNIVLSAYLYSFWFAADTPSRSSAKSIYLSHCAMCALCALWKSFGGNCFMMLQLHAGRLYSPGVICIEAAEGGHSRPTETESCGPIGWDRGRRCFPGGARLSLCC